MRALISLMSASHRATRRPRKLSRITKRRSRDDGNPHSQLLQTIGDLVLDETVSDGHLRQAIYHHIPRANLQVAVKEAHALRRPSSYFLTSSMTITAMCVSLAPQFLETLSFQSHQDNDTVLEAMAVFRSLNAANQRKLPDNVPLDFVTDNWRRFVMPQGHPTRRAYELCMLSTLRDKLRSGRTFTCPIAAGIPIPRRF